jgi:hypothetical protein
MTFLKYCLQYSRTGKSHNISAARDKIGILSAVVIYPHELSINEVPQKYFGS